MHACYAAGRFPPQELLIDGAAPAPQRPARATCPSSARVLRARPRPQIPSTFAPAATRNPSPRPPRHCTGLAQVILACAGLPPIRMTRSASGIGYDLDYVAKWFFLGDSEDHAEDRRVVDPLTATFSGFQLFHIQ